MTFRPASSIATNPTLPAPVAARPSQATDAGGQAGEGGERHGERQAAA